MNTTPKDSYLPIRLPAAQAQAVKDLAIAGGTTKSEVVRQAIAVLVAAQLTQPSPRRET